MISARLTVVKYRCEKLCIYPLTCKIFCRYRQILEKAIQFTDAEQLESLKAFVEASMLCPLSFVSSALSTCLVHLDVNRISYHSVSLTVVNENVSLVISRQLLTDFCTHLPNLPDATAKAVYHFTLEKIQPRVISFEEQVKALTLSRSTIWDLLIVHKCNY